MAKKRIVINYDDKVKCKWHHHGGGCGGAGYCLGVIGAMVYYVQTAVGFWGVIIAILKSLVWPAFLVYELLKFLAA